MTLVDQYTYFRVCLPGLFHGVIAQSGSAVASYCIHDDTIDFEEYVRDVGVLYKCYQTNVTAILECLRAVSARDFINRRMEVS